MQFTPSPDQQAVTLELSQQEAETIAQALTWGRVNALRHEYAEIAARMAVLSDELLMARLGYASDDARVELARTVGTIRDVTDPEARA